MCGIVGAVSAIKQEKTLEKMLEIQAYRGPDDRGVWIGKVKDKFIHLGHNRLSILDLSPLGHQPMLSDCGNFIIVFNGEVYNFKSIKKELQELGVKFKSSSDTEVILYAFRQWGVDCVEKFIGMFAIAILDKANGKLTLIRDRAGVKPLYYYFNDNEFLFASELKSFYEYSGFKKELNIEVLPYYFQFGYIPAPYSVFENCYKLEPGAYLELDIETLEFNIYGYWSVDNCYAKEKFDFSESEILKRLELILNDAVNLRMVADVPVGVFLSGGYDSSLVTAILSKSQKNLRTFTIGFDDKKYNEAKHAKMVAEYFGTKHTEYYVSEKEMLGIVANLPYFYDEPFGDSSAIPTMIVSKLAKKDVTVALSADGGDEAFCGYSKYFFLNKISSVFSSRLKKAFLKTAVNIFSAQSVKSLNSILPKKYKQTNIADKFNKFKRALNTGSYKEMFINASSYVSPKDVGKILKEKPQSILYGKFEMDNNLGFLDNMMRIDYKTFMVDDVLTKVDRAAMSVSLEGREPLIDHRIIEFMARVPESLKYKNNQGKYLARQILYKYIPQEIIDKPKSGFQIPLNEWLKGELKPLAEEYLSPAKLQSEIFNVDEVQRIKEAFFAGDSSYFNAIWFILSFQMWKEKWV